MAVRYLNLKTLLERAEKYAEAHLTRIGVPKDMQGRFLTRISRKVSAHWKSLPGTTKVAVKGTPQWRGKPIPADTMRKMTEDAADEMFEKSTAQSAAMRKTVRAKTAAARSRRVIGEHTRARSRAAFEKKQAIQAEAKAVVKKTAATRKAAAIAKKGPSVWAKARKVRQSVPPGESWKKEVKSRVKNLRKIRAPKAYAKWFKGIHGKDAKTLQKIAQQFAPKPGGIGSKMIGNVMKHPGAYGFGIPVALALAQVAKKVGGEHIKESLFPMAGELPAEQMRLQRVMGEGPTIHDQLAAQMLQQERGGSQQVYQQAIAADLASMLQGISGGTVPGEGAPQGQGPLPTDFHQRI